MGHAWKRIPYVVFLSLERSTLDHLNIFNIDTWLIWKLIKFYFMRNFFFKKILSYFCSCDDRDVTSYDELLGFPNHSPPLWWEQYKMTTHHERGLLFTAWKKSRSFFATSDTLDKTTEFMSSLRIETFPDKRKRSKARHVRFDQMDRFLYCRILLNEIRWLSPSKFNAFNTNK